MDGLMLIPIGGQLDEVRESFESTARKCSSTSLHLWVREDLQNLALDLVSALRRIPELRTLPSVTYRKNLLSDILRLNSAISSDDYDTSQIIPLLAAVIDKQSDDLIWKQIQAALAEATPPPRPTPSLDQTPYLHTTSSFVNSSEQRKYVDTVLKEELGSIYINVRGFYDAYFGGVQGLDDAGRLVFRKCCEGSSPLFSDSGWSDWPECAKESDVLGWLSLLIDRLCAMAVEEGFEMKPDRAVLTQPNRPLKGSMSERKVDVGIMRNSGENDPGTYEWSQVLVLGELKSNPKEDTASKTWRDLGRYAREVLTAQDDRRFFLGFTLCGPVMRLWEFDRLGAIASSPFNINEDGLKLVQSILGFLRMDDVQLGYDPTIRVSQNGNRFIEIVRGGHTERLVIDERMKRSACVVGRATTCWKAHREGDETNAVLVIKDSWQYPEREEEGSLLREATEQGVINVARYYHHETVQVGGKVDDIWGNVRQNVDVTRAVKYRPTRADVSTNVQDALGTMESHCTTSSAARKRTSTQTDASPPPRKRACSSSPTKVVSDGKIDNRVRRRVIVRDYGKPISQAGSRVVLLSGLASCIEGYNSLHKKLGVLQGDISTGNLILNEGLSQPWPAFLIDLDLSIKEKRDRPSGARGKTGTRAFMAIGLLLGEKHSFMHDLESFFWVLFWICVHSNPKERARQHPRFEKWNYVDMKELAEIKKGVVADEDDFVDLAKESFTTHYLPLVEWVNELRKLVFPNGARWKKEDKELYSRMKNILQHAQEDEKVIAGM